MDDDFGKSSLGFEENIVAIASYFGFLGVVIYLCEKRSHFVRFHALQSTFGFAVLGLFWLMTGLVGALYIVSFVPGLLCLLFAIHMGIKAYYGDEHRLPLIGDLAFRAIYETREDLLAVDAASGEPAEDRQV